MEIFMLFSKSAQLLDYAALLCCLKTNSSSNCNAFIMLDPQSLIHKLLSQENLKNFLP